ncbi:hypothetical protein [Vulcanisaeta sp. JCM 16159]|uniref:hypothetical protein n=1 Tax=Vulcanisaeta sp. JCM 16159 TaxID=1295371 RepID=UPI000B0B7841|nr:hypothetical protein [Vulcanisaeta sp. JCM 16159]
MRDNGFGPVDIRVRNKLGPVVDLEVRVLNGARFNYGVMNIVNYINDLLWEDRAGRVYYWVSMSTYLRVLVTQAI